MVVSLLSAPRLLWLAAMAPMSRVVAFIAVASVLIAAPGPSVLFTISRALTAGPRAARAVPVRPLRAVRDGFVVGATNPKSIVIFVVVLPEFTSRAGGYLPAPAQMLILGALFVAIALVLDSVWAAAAGTARQWLTRSPRRLELIRGAGGLAMVGLGISVILTGSKD